MNTKNMLPEAAMFELVDDLISMGIKTVVFSGGGELILCKPLSVVVERLTKGGVKVASLTNGSNLKGKIAAVFAAYGKWVRVSVDGWDDASYATAQKIKDGSFTTLSQNIRNFVDMGTNCTLGVSFIVGEANA